ncbi:MAG TPA: hypothetical protein VJU86_00350 [Pyrinomonadaceae bacterium]|nr:hypothetical protein [Pyrinomonadaceae bacterium]
MITNCDHLKQLKFAKSLPFAFSEHGALMAAKMLNSPWTVAERLCCLGIQFMREQLTVNGKISNPLAEIDKTLVAHDSVLGLEGAYVFHSGQEIEATMGAPNRFRRQRPSVLPFTIFAMSGSLAIYYSLFTIYHPAVLVTDWLHFLAPAFSRIV